MIWERAIKGLYEVPLLLFMLALGGMVGIGVALALKWIELSDNMANFAGGVAGATLGSAFAVFAAQAIAAGTARRERLAYCEMLLVEFIRLEALWAELTRIAHGRRPEDFERWKREWPTIWHFDEMAKVVKDIESYFPLRAEIGAHAIVALRRATVRSRDMRELFMGALPRFPNIEVVMETLAANVDIWREPIDDAMVELGKLARG